MPEPLPLQGTASMYADHLDNHYVKKMTNRRSDRYHKNAFSAALLGKHAGAVPFGTKLLSYPGRKVVVEVNDIGAGRARTVFWISAMPQCSFYKAIP